MTVVIIGNSMAKAIGLFGIYNDKTAKQYTDFSLFTAKEEYCNDITKLFNIIVGGNYAQSFEKIKVSPFGIREKK